MVEVWRYITKCFFALLDRLFMSYNVVFIFTLLLTTKPEGKSMAQMYYVQCRVLDLQKMLRESNSTLNLELSC
jgi:hypothetical protein